MVAPKIAVMTFDTAHLPEAQRFVAFAASIANSRVAQLSDGPFSCRARFWTIGPLVMSEQWVEPISFTRDLRMVRATGTDHYQLCVLLEGGNTIKRRRGDLRCDAGHAMITDLTRPETVHAACQHSILIQIPRAFLHAAIRHSISTACCRGRRRRGCSYRMSPRWRTASPIFREAPRSARRRGVRLRARSCSMRT